MGQDPAKVDRHIGQRLRHQREAGGLTQEELAHQLGISTAQIRMFEAGEKRIPPRHLIQVAELLKISINSFFQGAPDPVVSSDVSQISADVMRFLSMPESFALVSAFVALPKMSQRQAVVDYARTAGQEISTARQH